MEVSLPYPTQSGGGEGGGIGGEGGEGGGGDGGGEGGGGEGGGGEGGGGDGGGGDGGGGDAGGDSLQTAPSSCARYALSSATSSARMAVTGRALDGEVAIATNVARLTLSPTPHANTVAGRSLTSCAASTAV